MRFRVEGSSYCIRSLWLVYVFFDFRGLWDGGLVLEFGVLGHCSRALKASRVKMRCQNTLNWP